LPTHTRDNGRTAGSTVRKDAINLLRARYAEMGKGQLRGPDLEKTTFQGLIQMIRDDYAVNQRRSVRRLNTCVKVLEPFFGTLLACDVTLDKLNRYVSERLAHGMNPATVKLELTYLHRAFRLAERAGKCMCPPFPQITVQNVRTGFFERADFEAVRSHLPEAFRGPMTFAYLTGWRVPSEILTLRWKQVDFHAGTVRLEPGTTKNDEGRMFPFMVIPELADMLRSQWEKAISHEMATGQATPWVFNWSARGTIKPMHPKALYRRWEKARTAAGVPERIPHDFRRTVVRNLERAGVPRSVAMKLTGHKTEAVYRRYAIVCEADLTEGLKKLAALEENRQATPTDFSHSLATIPTPKPQIWRENMAEGARFELAVPLRGLRFSRPARSAAPSPLRTVILLIIP
jgi:integrase